MSSTASARKELSERFRTGPWNILIVAEKYQTGYDEPLLCAMYVDDRVMVPGFIDAREVEEAAAILFATAGAGQEHAERVRLERLIDAAKDRFKAERDEQTREDFRHHLASFKRFYGFVSQIVNLADPDLERLYAFGRLLLPKLPRRDGGDQIKLGG